MGGESFSRLESWFAQSSVFIFYTSKKNNSDANHAGAHRNWVWKICKEAFADPG
jgi:hypothetical protein